MSAALPPEPETRFITPAPEDYEGARPSPALLWPLFWLGLAVALWAVIGESGWMDSAVK